VQELELERRRLAERVIRAECLADRGYGLRYASFDERHA
jgi:hypothetical protein